ncbi:unnamed protein product [Trypanosoma congolense IL3000]|uniref:WGS project CAEQ00000000 data, annotated contig 67 n=1 Tax=Trypanosoma congolense (strain IL3000) TaxID=1068625 RepID=F9WHN2_TRYCI|nr:unnamed protein product [Trypanosoma congolense IL3000]
MVFANAKGNESGTHKYSLGNEKAATPGELKDCFSGKDFREESLVDISEKVSEQEPNLYSKIEGIKHQSLKDSFNGGSSAGCNLIKGKTGGILGKTDLQKSLWWGGGVLSIGSAFDGSTNSIDPGEIASATAKKKRAFWTADPAKQIVHLKNASDAFKAFKAVQETIQAKVKSIEDKIQACMGGQESGENTTGQNATEQKTNSLTCFDNVARITANLMEKRALLARYQKLKG